MPRTVLLDTNVFTAWLRPRSPLVPLYGRHVYGRRIAISHQTVAEARYVYVDCPGIELLTELSL